jgi:hypothetical protein
MGCTEATTVLTERWGCSRRTARRAVVDAYGEMVADLEDVQAADMLAAIIDRLERTARRADEAGQHAAAVGALRLLAELATRSGHHRPRFGSYGQ